MRPDDVQALVKRQPFVPFRIITVSGKSFDIRHPEMIKIGLTSLSIYKLSERGFYDTYDVIGLLLVERLEFIDQSAAVSQTA